MINKSPHIKFYSNLKQYSLIPGVAFSWDMTHSHVWRLSAHVSHFRLQKLPEGALRRLDLVQSKTRYLPLHLHSRRTVLPGVKGHHEITVSCPLPKYFTNALKKLEIPLPGKEWDVLYSHKLLMSKIDYIETTSMLQFTDIYGQVFFWHCVVF